MAQLYNVVLENKQGVVSILEHRNRSSWTKRTAIKHAKDMKTKGWHVSVGIYPADHSAPVQAV